MISVHERSKEKAFVASGFEVAANFQTPWLEVEKDARRATVSGLPDETSILFPIRIQLVVEFYSQKL